VSRQLGACFVAAAVSLGLLWLSLPAVASDAPTSFVLTANDTYGVEDCLLSNEECGQIVADGWCEAHGVGKAVTFGLQKAASRTDQEAANDRTNLEIVCSK
jgi:hypothetical protein